MPTPYAMDKWQAAAHVGLSADAIIAAIKADKLPAKQYRSNPESRAGKWLIRTADLEAWFEGLDGNFADDRKRAS